MANEFQAENMQVQQAVTAALEDQKKKKKKKRWIIIGVIVGVIIIFSVFWSIGSEDTSDSGSSGGSETVQKVEEQKSSDGKLGDYVCTVKSATKCKNWDGKDSVKIIYNFTNNSSSSQSFDGALEDKVFQDGIALESTFTSGSDENEVWDVQIKPGITKEVTKIYQLRDSSSDLEIEVSEWLSFKDEVYKKTVKF